MHEWLNLIDREFIALMFNRPYLSWEVKMEKWDSLQNIKVQILGQIADSV